MVGQVFTRNELYDLVWKEPMRTLAIRFHISDVGLAKICRKHSIPCPPRGYWAKIQNGHHPKKPKLPKPGTELEIHILGERGAPASTATRDQIPSVPVADSLRGCHFLVSGANQELQGTKTVKDGILVPSAQCAINVRVSRGNQHRALLIMDAVLKGFEAEGYPVSRGPVVTVGDIAVGFFIFERLDVVAVKPEGIDSENARRRPTRSPSGQLTLKILERRGDCADGRRKWSDSGNRRLETMLGRFLVGVVQYAGRARNHKEWLAQIDEEYRLKKAREKEEAQRLRDLQSQLKAEKSRVRELLRQAKGWRQSRLLREFVDAVRDACSVGTPPTFCGEPSAWIEWALQQADRLDPFVPNPPSILDQKIPEPKKRREWLDD